MFICIGALRATILTCRGEVRQGRRELYTPTSTTERIHGSQARGPRQPVPLDIGGETGAEVIN